MKKCQLDMLIFVQVCMPIDKNLNVFNSTIGSGRTNESDIVNPQVHGLPM